jgi:mono/diheme cytochrome c family protein
MAGVFGTPMPDAKRRGDDVLAQDKARQAPQAPQASQAAQASSGASLYAAACATCHGSDRGPPYGGINLALSSAFSGPDARNAANIVLAGIRPAAGERSPIMPDFADSMNDDQIAALLDYLRARFGKQPWTNTSDIVRDARRTQTVSLQTPPSPADATKRDKP